MQRTATFNLPDRQIVPEDHYYSIMADTRKAPSNKEDFSNSAWTWVTIGQELSVAKKKKDLVSLIIQQRYEWIKEKGRDFSFFTMYTLGAIFSFSPADSHIFEKK